TVICQPTSSGRGNELVIALMLAFELEEIVVAADFPVRIAAAHVRTSLVDRAAPRVGVEEAADRLIDVIALMSQDLLVDFLRLVPVREATLCILEGQIEMLRESRNVVIAYRNARMATAVARAGQAIVAGFHRSTREHAEGARH